MKLCRIVLEPKLPSPHSVQILAGHLGVEMKPLIR